MLEPLDDIVQGVLYDFVVWLTAREERLILSVHDDVVPAIEALATFLNQNGVDQTCQPLYQRWKLRCKGGGKEIG